MAYLQLDMENIENIAKEATAVLNSGGIILAPFDTVYGLICDPKNDQAIERIFKLKERDVNKNMGIAVSSLKQLDTIILTPEYEELIKEKTPGRYTFILKITEKEFSPYCYRNETIGVRIPEHKLILKIAEKFGAVAQTSANKSGKPNCFSLSDVKAQFSQTEIDSIDMIIDGGVIESKSPSEIWDLTAEIPIRIER